MMARTSITSLHLSQQEADMCRKAFAAYDTDGNGTISAAEFRNALTKLGQHPTEEELFVMIQQADGDGSGEVEFHEFCQAIARWKESQPVSNDADTLDAFIALGGNPDKTGKISTEKLRATIKEFELTLNIDKLIKEVDANGSGFIEYTEFATILS